MIKIPPPVLPEGLSEQEYRRLSILYVIMGCRELAAQANQRCALVDLSDPDFKELSVDQQISMSSEAGQDFALKLLKIVEEAKDDRQNLPDKLKAALAPLKGVIPEATMEQLIATTVASINDAYASEAPPRDVPPDLSAEEYFKLGKKYRECGWTELAREALKFAIDLGADQEVGATALQYLRTRVPRYPVPLMAEQLNIQGFNLMEVQKDYRGAKRVFLELIQKYPDFEWPYGNVASIYLRNGDLSPAEDHYSDAVKINPYYANGWLGLGRIYTLRGKFNEAKSCVNKASEIDSDPSVAAFISLIEQIEDWQD